MSKVQKNLLRLVAYGLAFVMCLSVWGNVGKTEVHATSFVSDVTFSYLNFPARMQADLFEMVTFSVEIHLPPPVTGVMPSGTFQWRRNGENWTEPGGSGSLHFDSFGNAQVHLVLRDGLSQAERGGIWYLRVSIARPANNEQNNDQNNNQANEPGPLIRNSREAVLTIVDGRLLWTPPPPMPVWPPPPPIPPPTPMPTPPYAPFGNLDGVNNTATAVEAVRQAFLASTPQDLSEGLLELFAEKAIMHSATQYVFSENITLSSANLAHLTTSANLTRASIDSLFFSLHYTPQRSLRTSVALISTQTGSHNINIDPTAANLGVDFIWVLTPNMDVGITREFLANNVANRTPLTISTSSRMERVLPHAPMLLLMPDPVELIGVPTVTPPPPRAPVGPAPPLWRPGGASFMLNPALQDIAGGWVEMRTYQVSFSRTVTDPVRLSVAPLDGARTFQVVRDINTGSIQNSRANRVTGNLDTRVRTSGNFTVVNNEVNFVDTQGLSIEMQMAIKNLASQGILHGFNRLEFRPHEPITRAQAASIISRMIGIYDTNANGGFTDVRRGDWYFGAVGSVQRAGLMFGVGVRQFGPNINFPKDQLVVLSGRILRQEMRYHIPPNPHGITQQYYVDWASLPHWSINDIALATRLNLIVPRADNLFAPNSVLTRGEVALIMHRMYLRLW